MYDKKYNLSRYRLTLDQFEQMKSTQGNACGICSEHMERPCVDHCHATGKVRGLLCSHCNKGLGFFRDQPARLHSAADYLRRS